MASVYGLSWGKTSFPAKLLLLWMSWFQEGRKIWSGDPQVKAEGYSALSSTYYSIAGTAQAQLKAAWQSKWLYLLRVLVWHFSWGLLGAYCYWRMLPLSDRAVSLIGYEGMTADQCEIRGSILRARQMYSEAEKCILLGLDKEPDKAHTRGLLRIGLADVYQKTNGWCKVDHEVQLAIAEAKMSERYDPRQASRIYRKTADLLSRTDAALAGQYRRRAYELARQAGSYDQLLKQQ